MKELMYFALIMLKRISPSDLVDFTIPTTPTAKPAPTELADPGVATKSPEAEPEPLVATSPKSKPSSSKKGKNK